MNTHGEAAGGLGWAEEMAQEGALPQWTWGWGWGQFKAGNFFFFFTLFYLFIFLNYFILFYLFSATLGLGCCTWAFGERGLLFVAVRGLLIVVASLVAEHGH